jgi:hypothetical protein
MKPMRDRFLLGILIGIGVLVVLALILFFTRRSQLTFVDDSTPSGALQNYILALQKRDYSRAYHYLVDLPNGPTLQEFSQPFLSYQAGSISNTAVEIGEVILDAQNQTAVVQLTLLQGSGDIFSTATRMHDTASLALENGAWKVIRAPYPYWSPVLPEQALPKLLPTPTEKVAPTATAP